MDKTKIIEEILLLLKQRSLPYNEIHKLFFPDLRKSEFSSCIKDLINEKFIDYSGSFDDNQDVVLNRFGEYQLKKLKTYSIFLESKIDITLYDKVVKWGKNNIFMVISMILIAIIGSVMPLKQYFKIANLSDDVSKTTKDNDTLGSKNAKGIVIEIAEQQPKDLESEDNTNKKLKIYKPNIDSSSSENALCQDIKKVITQFVDNNLENIKGSKTGYSAWTSKLDLTGSISNRVMNYGGLTFRSTYYSNYDSKEAWRMYGDLKNKLSCFGAFSRNDIDVGLGDMKFSILTYGDYKITVSCKGNVGGDNICWVLLDVSLK